MTATNGRIGTYVTRRIPDEAFRAYIPPALPPTPPVDFRRFAAMLDQANVAVGRLDAITTILPDPSLFIYMYVRKEAVLSSQIEGTQSSLSDLLLHESGEAAGVPIDDVQEVSSYVAALDHGLKRLAELPLSVRLLREIHGVLLATGRGSDKAPGEFRTTQNWIGGSRPGNAAYVPPPPEEVAPCMSDLEKFLHGEPGIPVLIKAAMAHVQFETIHPFLDGNGRVGRLLITFLLCAEGVLREPTLYLSLYFKQNRARYYDLLQNVRLTGDWESWVEFFLTGVADTANQAVETARRINALFAEDRTRISALKRIASTVLRVQIHLERHPIATVAGTTKALGLSFHTVQSAFTQLEKLGVVREVGGRRGRTYVYSDYSRILSEGTEPIRTPG